MIFRHLSLAILLATPVAASAQSTLSGKLIEHATGRPMYCYSVELLDSAGLRRDSLTTDRGGVFEFRVPDGAPFRLRVGSSARGLLTEPERAGTATQLTRLYRIPWLERVGSEPDTVRPVTPPRFVPARGGRGPQYPRELLAAGVTGHALFAFTIDTSGRIDTASALALRSTHPLFERAVRHALPRMRFLPWTPLPNEHCALLQQRFNFDLEP